MGRNALICTKDAGLQSQELPLLFILLHNEIVQIGLRDIHILFILLNFSLLKSLSFMNDANNPGVHVVGAADDVVFGRRKPLR
jgi:hypothetical protein